MAPIKNIHKEFRFFVVNGKIVSGSLYKLNELKTTSPIVDYYVYRYVEKMIGYYQPELAFCLDIALIDNGELKVIEVNSINSSGLYELDVNKFVYAIEELKYTVRSFNDDFTPPGMLI